MANIIYLTETIQQLNNLWLVFSNKNTHTINMYGVGNLKESFNKTFIK